MPREFARTHRVAEQIKRELGVLITTEVKDPRVKLAAITEVNLSPDLKHAKVYVGSFDLTAPRDGATQVLDGLRAARGFLKRALGARLRLRRMPELAFYEDASEREAQQLERVIETAVARDRRRDEARGDDPQACADDAAPEHGGEPRASHGKA